MGSRAYLSDHIPLAGNSPDTLRETGRHFLHVNPKENPLWIYLHAGGRRAVYFGLFDDANGNLDYILVRVASTRLNNIFLLARGPIKRPVGCPRTQLSDASSNSTLRPNVSFKWCCSTVGMFDFRASRRCDWPYGRNHASNSIRPYDALYRETLISPSPFYRLICGWKMYEGAGRIRRQVREGCERRRVPAKLPADPTITTDRLREFDFTEEFAFGITCAPDLFEKLRETRNAISHFLIDTDDGESMVYVADGRQLHHYSMCAAAMLHYSYQALEDLSLFSVKNGVHLRTGKSMILPMPQNRDQFPVRASDYGME